MADSAPEIVRRERQSVAAPQAIAMPPFGAPWSLTLRPNAWLALFLTFTIRLIACVSSDPIPTNLNLVCKTTDFKCEVWTKEDLVKNSRNFYRKDLYSHCGLSDLKPIPPHKRFIAVERFSQDGTRFFCNVKSLRLNLLSEILLSESPRVRRQAGYRLKGRYRGQTQSQYLSIDRGNGKDEGKAEAHSAADSSRAIVSGNSGMGQAQSQTIFDPSCEECIKDTDPDAANLAIRPQQGYPYQPKSTTNQKPGDAYTPLGGSFDTSKHFPNGLPNQQISSNGGNGYNQPPGQSGASYTRPSSNTNFNTFPQGISDNNHQRPLHSQYNPQGNPGPGQVGASQLPEGSYSYPRNNNIGNQQNSFPDSSHNRNQPDLYNQQSPSESYPFKNSFQPTDGSLYNSQQIPNGQKGTGQGAPFGNQVHNVPNGRFDQPGSSITGQMVPSNQAPGGEQYTISGSQLPGVGYDTSQQNIPSRNQQGSPDSYYNQPRNMMPGGQTVQTPGNFYQQKSSDNTNLPTRPNLATDVTRGSGLSGNANKIANQGVFNPNSPLNHNGMLYQNGQGEPAFTGQGNINWPLFSSLLPAAGPDSTYFCCVVNPGGNIQNGNLPAQNIPFGGSNGQNAPQSPHSYIPNTGSYRAQGAGPQNTQMPNIMQVPGSYQTPTNSYNSGNLGQNNLQPSSGGQGGTAIGQNNLPLPNVMQGGGDMSPNNLLSPSGHQGVSSIIPNNLQPNGVHRGGNIGQNNIPSSYRPLMESTIGQGNLKPNGLPGSGILGQNGVQPGQQGGGNIGQPNLQPNNFQGGVGQNAYQPNGMQGGENMGINNLQTPYGHNGRGNIGGQNTLQPNGLHGGGNLGQNPLQPSQLHGNGGNGQNNFQPPYAQHGGGNIGINNLQPNGLQGSGNVGVPGMQPSGLQGGGNIGVSGMHPNGLQGGGKIGVPGMQPNGLQGGGNGGESGIRPNGLQGSGNVGTSGGQPNGLQGGGYIGVPGMQPNGIQGGGNVGVPGMQSNGLQGGGNLGVPGVQPNGLQGGGNVGVPGMQPNGLQGGGNVGVNGMQPNGLQEGNIGQNNLASPYGTQERGTSGQQPIGLQGGNMAQNNAQFPYGLQGGTNIGQNHQPFDVQGRENFGPNNLQSPYGQQGNVLQGGGSMGQNNLQYPYGQNTYQPNPNYQQHGSGTGGSQEGYTPQSGDQNGVPQNVIDPNAISSSLDDYDSEAQASVAQAHNGTSALASSKGGNAKGRAQTQVEGTYTGTGSFSANAEISDDSKAAQSHVSGSKKGASSSSEGRGRKNKSQASVKLGSETGSISTDSQSSGDMHSSGSQVQGSVKGGMADAQAKGPGSTSSQAQIGFTPFKEEDKKAHDQRKTPFEGSGTASAQSSGRMGTSQSQLRGTFKYGITYNGAAQAGSSVDKDAVFSNLLPFDKIDVFNEKNKNINVDDTTPQISIPEKEVEYDQAATEKDPIEYTTETNHSHSDHHETNSNHNTTTRPPAEGNRRSFDSNYGNNGEDYEYSTDKEESPPDEYDIDDGFGAENDQVEQTEYNSYDEFNREPEQTHQSYQSSNKKGLEVSQSTGGNTQHIILGSLNKHDTKIIQKSTEHPDESKIYQPGERVPGMGGYTIPAGFTGSVRSVASKDKTYVVGSKSSPSQAQTVTLTPGSGKVKYANPSNYRMNVNPKDMRSLYNSKVDDSNRYVSVSKSVTRDLDSENNIRKQYSHTYYTKSSSCGYFTFTCTMVSSAEGKKKVCRPKIPTNPDGTPMRC